MIEGCSQVPPYILISYNSGDAFKFDVDLFIYRLIMLVRLTNGLFNFLDVKISMLFLDGIIFIDTDLDNFVVY